MAHNPEQEIPKPRFTGIFIPIEILELKKSLKLSYLELLLLSWIDALYSEKHGGCFASNEYLADKLNTEEDTISKAITRLRRFGLIEKVSFNGRKRIIKALIGKIVDRIQTLGRVGQTSYSAKDKNPSSVPPLPYKYSKDDIKDNTSSRNAVVDTPATNKNFQIIGKYKNVKLTEKQINELKKKLKEDYAKGIEKFSSYLEESSKKYSSHYRAILNWIPNWIHNQKQEVINNKNLIEKNKAALEKIIDHLEKHPTRGNLRRTPTGAEDTVWNRTFDYSDRQFVYKVAKLYKLDIED